MSSNYYVFPTNSDMIDKHDCSFGHGLNKRLPELLWYEVEWQEYEYQIKQINSLKDMEKALIIIYDKEVYMPLFNLNLM